MRTHLTAAQQPLFVLLWSSAFIAGIIGVGAAAPMMVLFTRFVVAGGLLAAYSVAVRAVWPRGRELRHVVTAGLLMQIVQFGGFYSAMAAHVPGAVIALVQGLSPVVVALCAGFLGETVTARQWFGFVIGGAGVGLAVADQAAFSAAGLVLCGIGLAGLSLGTVYQKRFAPQVDPRTGTAVHLLASAPAAGLLGVVTDQLHVWDAGRFAASMTWIVLLNSIVGFLMYNSMLRRLDATRVSRLLFATPAVTALLAWLTIAQPVHPLTAAGLAVGLVGMVFATRRPSPAPAPQRPRVAV